MLGASSELPIEDLQGVDAERIFEGLIGAGAVAVEGNGVTVDAKLGHRSSFARILKQCTTEGAKKNYGERSSVME